jgi:hypothetical protein
VSIKNTLRFFVLTLLCSAAAWATQPTVTKISHATAGPFVVVTLDGTDFGPSDQGAVRFNDKAGTVVAWSPTQVAVRSPANPGQYELRVCSNGICSSPLRFFVVATPAVSPSVANFDNGIVVSGVKQYSDAALQSMLDASRQKLMSLQMLDPAAIGAHIGTVTGANQSVSGFALNVSGPSVPGVVTTANSGGTSTSVQNGTSSSQTGSGVVTTLSAQNGSSGPASSSQLVITSPSSTSGSTGSAATNVTGPSTAVVTTQAPASPTIPTASTSSPYTAPSGISVSAADVLQEQMQLNADIAGYALLLDGAIDDHVMVVPEDDPNNPGQTFDATVPLQRITLGIPVDIRNSGKYPDAIAEVRLSVETDPTAATLQTRPGITALLPTQKTYNVASIVDHSLSLGGGVVTGIASVGVSWLWGHHTYNIVKDQDTVAFTLPDEAGAPRTQGLGWQFRPVLGRHRVEEGPRQVFVQLAFPTMSTPPSVSPSLGMVSVTTAWKKVDKKTGAISDTDIPGSTSTYTAPFVVRQYDLSPKPGMPEWSDNGDGTMTVMVPGPFFPGVSVLVGPNVFSDGTLGFLRTPASLQFTIANIDAATKRPRVMDRSGAATEILIPGTDDSSSRRNQQCFTLDVSKVTPLSSTQTLVDVKVNIKDDSQCGGTAAVPSVKTTDLVAVIGTKVFGTRDAPLAARTADTLSVLVPTDLLRANREITVKQLFAGAAFSNRVIVDTTSVLPSATQAVALGTSAKGTQFAVLGSGLEGLTAVNPTDATVDVQSGTAAIVTIPNNEITGLKQMVLKDKTGTLLLVSTPTNQAADGPSLDPIPPIKVGGNGLIKVTGKGIAKLSKVTYNKLPVKIVSKDDRSATLLLPKEAIGIAGTPTLEFYFDTTSKVDYNLSVVDQKLQIQSDTTPTTTNATTP